jgi:hypothetical protein
LAHPVHHTLNASLMQPLQRLPVVTSPINSAVCSLLLLLLLLLLLWTAAYPAGLALVWAPCIVF